MRYSDFKNQMADIFRGIRALLLLTLFGLFVC